ncbi:MAG: LysM domain-containing protein [Gammaproteobacteria bacterium]|nr:LysM domain-containing protein [Gammaproteobacteria bacterium]
MSQDKLSANSRYATTAVAQYTRADGSVVSYFKRRFIPRNPGTVISRHSVVEGERPDTIAAKTLGDPEQYWRLCDANGSMHPNELTDEVGKLLIIAIASGVDDA